MRLKKIRLAGFKSFVDPTNIPFPGNMTAILGPNGCGKSNVIDAVRWVLGESSAKNLRGDSMIDVIFNGSTARKPVSQCSVELVFDNSSNRIQGEFAAFNEISVKRIVTKEAVSTYFLNGSKCRRRDVTDLFLGTGLGPRSYAIIEQGMISRLIESKPQELRVFIEEAAGISKYKERRKETKTRILHTKENLERLQDVRQELGDQINKLARQASAANRYRDLKKRERQLKAELATIKWLVQSNLINDIQAKIDEKKQALEQLLSNQQGKESGLQQLKNDQAICKQNIDDMQQSLFNVGTDITKLEQSQLFAKKRENQIQAEIAQIKLGEPVLHDALKGIDVELQLNQQKLVNIEPEKAIVEAQLFELEEKTYVLEERLTTFSNTGKAKQDEYYQQSQLLQQKHSQIQQTLSLQARTETRLNELKDELAQIASSELTIEKQATEKSLQLTQKTGQQLKDILLNAQTELVKVQQNAQVAQNDYEDVKLRTTQLKANLKALEALQIDSEDDTTSNLDVCLSGVNRKPAWQHFKVEKGYEKVLQRALLDIEHAQVVDTNAQNEMIHQRISTQIKQQKDLHINVLYHQSFTSEKVPNTLASLMLNELVPRQFNFIYVVDDLSQAFTQLTKIQEHAQVISKDGIILQADALNIGQRSDNKFLRMRQIEDLTQQYEQISVQLNQCHTTFQNTQHVQDEAQNKVADIEKQITENKQQQHTIELTLKNLLFQEQQNLGRKTKLQQDLQECETQLEQENMSLEVLNEQVEDISIVVMQLEQEKDAANEQLEAVRQEQNQLLTKQSVLQKSLHEFDMQVQQIRNNFQILQEQKETKAQILLSNEQKLQLLSQEAEELSMPAKEQEQKMQSMLASQTQLRTEISVKQNELDEINEGISTIEKGQHGVLAKVDEMKTDIQSHQIRIESASVRAQSYIEQLDELKQPIKDVLQAIQEQSAEQGFEQADENKWQSELDKVIAGIQRLGAVNLAAVDEYEEQSKRKAHLDEQNQDLSDALETLENAMRKIDKETRTRFKHTFDKVNNDLKTLFPKVFGGGMAYLDLTDDDMLETGVTIMARPPGKKNSTIQLLSGGEKALTALSLVFAIFRLNPAPFCLLDEVDAPLDDANVGRFCRLVSQMSETVQFIYITHNKVAMEMATHLTGVTMAEPGVSRMVAVDMEQALAIAQ